MALVCDYCGDNMTGEDPVEVLFDHSTNYSWRDGCNAKREFYYCPGECANTVGKVLTGMSKWAVDGEGSGLRWALVKRPGAALAPEQESKSGEKSPRPPGSPGEKSRRSIRRSFDGAKVASGAANALRVAGIFSLEDAAQRCEVELLAIERVGTTTVHALKRALEARGLSLRAGPSPAELGDRVRELRESAGLSQDGLARALNDRDHDRDRVYAPHVSAWEGGRRSPTQAQFERLAEYFGREVTDLLAVREEAS